MHQNQQCMYLLWYSNTISFEITSLAVHMSIQKHMYISTPLHEEAIIHSIFSWMKCIIVLVKWGAYIFLGAKAPLGIAMVSESVRLQKV